MELKVGTIVKVTDWKHLMRGDYRGRQGIIIAPIKHSEVSAFWVKLTDEDNNLPFLASELAPIDT